MKLENKERLYLLSLVKEDLFKINSSEKSYGLAKLTTMYTAKSLLEGK